MKSFAIPSISFSDLSFLALTKEKSECETTHLPVYGETEKSRGLLRERTVDSMSAWEINGVDEVLALSKLLMNAEAKDIQGMARL